MSLQCVLDALRARKERFMFEDNDIVLKPSVMAFITMNPGYPGRAELPESLKVRAPLCHAWSRLGSYCASLSQDAVQTLMLCT